MSTRIASVLAWILGIFALLSSLGHVSRFSSLPLAARTTLVWLLCAGIAFVAVGIGLPLRHRYAAWTAVIVCGLWLTIQGAAVIRLLSAGANWSVTTWIIIATQSLFCVVILTVVLHNRVRDRTWNSPVSHSDAA